MKILLVDDDPAILEIFEIDLQFTYEDSEIFKAENGVDALELCMKESFDLIFTDGKMPKMDGLELAQKLSDMNYPATIVLITGYHKVIDELNDDNCGLFKVLCKPVKFEELHACVDYVKKNLSV